MLNLAVFSNSWEMRQYAANQRALQKVMMSMVTVTGPEVKTIAPKGISQSRFNAMIKRWWNDQGKIDAPREEW